MLPRSPGRFKSPFPQQNPMPRTRKPLRLVLMTDLPGDHAVLAFRDTLTAAVEFLTMA